MSTATSSSDQVRSAQTQQKLLDAGIALFASLGYDATSTRQVEMHAGVQRNLINYHFGSKESFWKACMVVLFDRMVTAMGEVAGLSRDLPAGEAVRFLIRRYVRASADHPEITRIMFDEGRRDDWRLAWLVENYTREFYERVGRLFETGQEAGCLPALSLVQFYYVLVSSTVIFAMAPECRLLSGADPDNDTMIDAQADAIVSLLTGNREAQS
jgi:AcrR family transcriptional regulator